MVEVTQEDRAHFIKNLRASADMMRRLGASSFEAHELDAIADLIKEDTTALAAKEAENAELRAKVERLREALTPSGDTKAAYHGEFAFSVTRLDENGEEYPELHYVPWTTVKEIMATIRGRAALTEAQP